jgi:hypothetical protein
MAVITMVTRSHSLMTQRTSSLTWSTRWNSESRSVGSTLPAISRRCGPSVIESLRTCTVMLI